jgi:hypothetical protein
MVATALTCPIRQRADYTFKENTQHGRHGWLRLTPAYSVRLVERILSEFGERAQKVFEPFSGTGTTPLCAAYRGIAAVATDINPFLIWLGRAKAARYTDAQRRQLESIARRILARSAGGKTDAGKVPPIRNIERWWYGPELEFLSGLRAEIERSAAGPVLDLLKIAFCRTMIALSNAAFNHQSMSFKSAEAPRRMARGRAALQARLSAQFEADIQVVSASTTDNPVGEVQIDEADARGLGELGIAEGSCDLLITSPPYPNRMSYIRELRPYMYWLGYLEVAKEAGELDWEAIGGTWGIATSRLLTWRPAGEFIPDYLLPIVQRIRLAHPKNGVLMAQYVHKYFEDMSLHFRAAARVLRSGGSAHYVVGNSTFYGQLVPAERVYVDQLLAAGFRHCEARPIRKRNSKKELIEFHVIAQR